MIDELGVSLPAGWPLTRLKLVTSLISRGNAPSYSSEGPVRAISQAANQEAGIDWNRTRFHAHTGEISKLKGLLKSGDSIVNSTGTGTLGRVGIFTASPDGIPCMADGHISIVRFNPTQIHPKFGHYWMRSRPFMGYLYNALAVGATNQIELNRERLANAPIPIPPLEKQRQIVTFLDAESRLIDDLIERSTRMTSLMNERIETRILDYIAASPITGGGDSRVPVSPVRRLLKKEFRHASDSPEVVTAYRDGQVIARSKRRAEGYTLSSSQEAQGQQVKVNDVVIHGLDGFSGAIGTSESEGNCSPVYHVCTPQGGGNSLFIGRMLRTLAVSGYLGLFAISTRERAVDFRNWELFGGIPVPDVPIAEQAEVGTWIESAKRARVAVDRLNALLQERRTALVTDTVTGSVFDPTHSAHGQEV